MRLEKNISVTTSSEEETLLFGKTLAALIEQGDIICLYGNLGAGKTCLVKGIAEGLGIKPELVNSPTFTLIHEYHGSNMTVYHFDAYRLKSVSEALEIGAEEYLFGDGVSLVEWPEKLGNLIPPSAIRIQIEKAGATLRTFEVKTGTTVSS